MAKREVKFNDFSQEVFLRGKEYRRAIDRVLSSGWFILGKEVASFEEEFAKYLGIKYCIGVANGLEALQIAFMAAGVGKGDEVITTPVSAMASTLAILAVGATPVFVDTDRLGRLDYKLIQKAVSRKTKAVLPVHLYGIPVEVAEIKQICVSRNLVLIEDAAQAHGSTSQGRVLGTLGEMGCFSFYPTKNLGAFGDGGAIVTRSKLLADKCRQIRDYGQAGKYQHTVYGLNSRLDEIQAAILRVKLKYLDRDNSVRRMLAKRYVDNLLGVKQIEIVGRDHLNRSNFHLFTIRVKDRDKLQAHLGEGGVSTLVHYPVTLPDQPLFGKKYAKLEIPRARKFVQEIISLPCHPLMKEDDVVYISELIRDYFA